MTLIGIVIGQRFAGKRINSKFRPNAEWFEEMQGSSLPSDFEQSDQPPQEDDIAFRDFFVEDFEPMETEVREGKFPRGTAVAKKVEVFQNICPYINKTIVPSDTDPDYEFIPHVYQEIVCAYPYQQQSRLMFDQKKNFVCHSDRGFNCVQLTSSIFLLKRRHVNFANFNYFDFINYWFTPVGHKMLGTRNT